MVGGGNVVDKETTEVTVEGNINNSGIRKLPWFPKSKNRIKAYMHLIFFGNVCQLSPQ